MSSGHLREVDMSSQDSARSNAAGCIRALNGGDVPAVGQLFQRTFRDPHAAAPDSLVTYLRKLFVEHPWQDPEICSLVFVGADGRIGGFIGVLPLRMSYRGKPLRAAVLSSLMVADPQHNPMAGARLLRSVLQGPQDLSLSDTANALSQGMWERLGGRVFPAYGMDWIRVIEPTAMLVKTIGKRIPFIKMFSPFAKPLDYLLRHTSRNPFALTLGDNRGVSDIAVDDEEFISAISYFCMNYPLRPAWDPAMLRWILQHAATKEAYGSLERRLVYGADEELIGGHLCYGRRVGFVLQIFAKPGAADKVIDNLFTHAIENGYIALRGRTQPEITDALLRRRCIFLHHSSMVVHSHNLELIDAIRSGDAMITGLAAESWTRLVAGEFV